MSCLDDYVFSGNIYEDSAGHVIGHTSPVKPWLCCLSDQTDQLLITLTLKCMGQFKCLAFIYGSGMALSYIAYLHFVHIKDLLLQRGALHKNYVPCRKQGRHNFIVLRRMPLNASS